METDLENPLWPPKGFFWKCMALLPLGYKEHGVVLRRSWQLGKQEIPTPSRSSSPVSSAATCTDHHLEVDQRARSVSKGSSLAPMTESHKYTVNHGERVLELARVVLRRSWQLGKQEIPTPSRSSSPVLSAATYTDHHLEVNQRATSVDTTCGSVDTLSQNSPESVLGSSLVSTLPHLVSTHCPSLTQKVLGS
ncbi:hypothetical protein Taro_002044 [Colocasia esculenta]|uniref:Uncharacterized protein n=1 Tax=Colocasia esculenta TaxID=4460 RepID=A0A843THN2_COLES|nr:hypothetical protein [Colocasia esculenta]